MLSFWEGNVSGAMLVLGRAFQSTEIESDQTQIEDLNPNFYSEGEIWNNGRLGVKNDDHSKLIRSVLGLWEWLALLKSNPDAPCMVYYIYPTFTINLSQM